MYVLHYFSFAKINSTYLHNFEKVYKVYKKIKKIKICTIFYSI